MIASEERQGIFVSEGDLQTCTRDVDGRWLRQLDEAITGLEIAAELLRTSARNKAARRFDRELRHSPGPSAPRSLRWPVTRVAVTQKTIDWQPPHVAAAPNLPAPLQR